MLFTDPAPGIAELHLYGATTQAQFEVDTEHPADTGLDALTAISPDDIHATDTDMTENLAAYGLEYKGSTLVCRTTTLIRHYYKIVDQDKFDLVKNAITIDGVLVQYKEKNGEIYFEIKDVAAADLDADYTLKTGTNEYKYSSMHYAKRVLQYESEGTTMWNLATALYWYNQAANTYFGR